jgi:hypothetical protein
MLVAVAGLAWDIM